MSELKVTLDIKDQNIAIIKMCDKLGKNSFSDSFVLELEAIIDKVSNHDEVKVVLLSGLPDIFCSGADLETLKNLTRGNIQPTDIKLAKLLLDIPIPVISVMQGHAIGGGLALGLCADIVILSEESRYGCSFMNMGFTPGMGITKLMEHYMTPSVAHEMMYTGINKKGSELKTKTNFNYILPKKDVGNVAQNLCSIIAEKPKKSLMLLKRYLSISRRQIFEETFSIESMMHEISFNQKDILDNLENNYVK